MIMSCFDLPRKNHSRQKPQGHLMSLSVSYFETGSKEPFLVYTFRVYTIEYIRMRVHYQISCLIPQSVRRCNTVSWHPHCLHLSLSFGRILYNLTFVGRMTWITKYHVDLSPSGNFALWRLLHTRDQLMAGWSRTMRNSRDFFTAA